MKLAWIVGFIFCCMPGTGCSIPHSAKITRAAEIPRAEPVSCCPACLFPAGEEARC